MREKSTDKNSVRNKIATEHAEKRERKRKGEGGPEREKGRQFI